MEQEIRGLLSSDSFEKTQNSQHQLGLISLQASRSCSPAQICRRSQRSLSLCPVSSTRPPWSSKKMGWKPLLPPVWCCHAQSLPSASTGPLSSSSLRMKQGSHFLLAVSRTPTQMLLPRSESHRTWVKPQMPTRTVCPNNRGHS